jgi:hypothetical protein
LYTVFSEALMSTVITQLNGGLTGQTSGRISAMTKRHQATEGNIDRETANTLINRIADLSLAMDKMNIAEYVEFLRNPKRIIFVNFLGGLARGFGIGIGATILAALFVIILPSRAFASTSL